MRCFGSCTHTLQALIYRLMELAAEQGYWTRESPAYTCLRRLFSQDSEQKVLFEAVKMLKKAQIEEKSAIWEKLDSLGKVLMQRFQVIPENPMSFASLCAEGEFALSLFGLELGPKCPFEAVILQQKQGVLFLLYSSFTDESFVDFPCGHFALKYEYYRQLQGLLGSRAASSAEIQTLGIPCWSCQSDVSEAISRSCAGERPLPLEVKGDFTSKCGFCGWKYEGKLPGLCKVHDICPKCAIKHYTTANFDLNRCCHTQMTDYDLLMFREAVEMQFPEYIPLLEMVKHDKKVANFKFLAAICAVCREKYALDESNICEKCKNLASSKASNIQFTVDRLCPVCRKAPLTTGTKCDICKKAETVKTRKLAHPGMPNTTGSALDLTQSNPGSSSQEDFPAMNRANSTQEKQTGSWEQGRRGGKWSDQAGNRPTSVERRREGRAEAMQGYGEVEERKKWTESDDKGRVKALPANLPEEDSGLETSDSQGKPRKCRTCNAPYTREDEDYFCPGACRCRRCAVEALVEVPTPCICKLCGGQYQPEVLKRANMGRKRCHVCGIAVDIAEMTSNMKCIICIKCVVISEERTFLVIPKIKGKCRLHPKTLYSIDTQYYQSIRERDPHSACCSFEYTEGKVLKCGHTVCATHQKHLLFCRACQAPVDLLDRYHS